LSLLSLPGRLKTIEHWYNVLFLPRCFIVGCWINLEDFVSPKSTLTVLVAMLTFPDPELCCFLIGSLNEPFSFRFYKFVVLAAPTSALRDFLELTISRIGDLMETP